MTKATSALDQETIIKKALVELRETKARLGAIEAKETEPIAIIGIGCRFPGNVHNRDTFWKLLHHGIDAITEVPADRWNINQYYDPNPDAPGKMYSRHGGFVDHLKDFDAAFFGISPREALSLDPQQRLLLEVSWEALESADVNPHVLSRLSTGVFIGICSNDYTQHLIAHGEDRIDAYLATGNAHSTAAGRLSFLLGLTGPSLAVDTSCSSSLVALHLACSSLRDRESDVALAGGVNRLLSPTGAITFCKARMLAADGRCKTFDISADGFVRSEGCGMVVLKRLSDAQRDGDNIMALIRGSAINQDGHTSGLTVPNGPSQQAVIRQALQAARVNPVQVSYVEAHGTGTSLGDPIEVGALGAVFGPHHSEERPLAIGSVKTNIGHLEAAAGIAGLIKVVLQLQHQEIAPHLHLRQPNPYIDWESWPVKIPTQPLPWTRGEEPRIAGVSSFGFSGTNAHVIVQEAPAPVCLRAEVERPLHLLALSAQSQSALSQLAQEYEGYLKEHPEVELADICFSSNIGRVHFDERLALVGGNRRELLEQLKAWQLGEITPPVSLVRGDIGLLFTGQGSQYVGMGQQLYASQPTFRKTLDHCAEILNSYLDKPLESIIYPVEGEDSLLHQTAYTQPALFALEYALYQLWRSWGIQPAAVMGHSVGEYVAACVAGVFSLEDGLKLIAMRGKLMQQLPTGGEMFSLQASESKVRSLIAPYIEKVAIAAINGPESVVISGSSSAVRAIASELESEGIKTKQLPVSHAFHSPLMEPMLAEFEAVAKEITFSLPQISLISNVSGLQVRDEITSSEYWVRQIRQPVQFAQSMKTLSGLGYELFLEIGPKPILLGMGRQCFSEDRGVWLPSLRPEKEEWQQMLESLGQLYVRGAQVNWSGFYRDYANRKVALPTYPFQRQRYWVDTTPATSRRKQYGAIAPKQHPLLGEKLNLAGIESQQRFQGYLADEEPPYLKDHKVFEKVLFPATGYLEMAIAAARNMFGRTGAIVADVVIARGLMLPETEIKSVQTVATPLENKGYKLEIFTTTEGERQGSWTFHAEGKIYPQEIVSQKAKIDIEKIKGDCDRTVDVAQHYQNCRELGIDYGRSFQGIKELSIGLGKAIGRIVLPSDLADTAAEYNLHPALLDAALQMIGHARETSAPGKTYLPIGIEKLQLYGHPGEQVWAIASMAETSLKGDIILADSAGNVMAEIAGLRVREATAADIARSLQADISDWFYEIVWQEKPRKATAPTKGAAGKWLLLAANPQIAAGLKEKGLDCVTVSPGPEYKQLAGEQYQINPTSGADFNKLLQENQGIAGVVHMWGVPPRESQENYQLDLQKSQEESCAAALHLVQGIIKSKPKTVPGLWLVTLGTQSVISPTEAIAPEYGSLWGLGRVIALEHPEMQCKRIDLDPQVELTQALAPLVDELLSGDWEDQIAIREGSRYAARLGQKQQKKPSNLGDKPVQLKLSEYGIIDNLSWQPMQRRSPKASEVELRVTAVGLNFRDVLNALGLLKDYYGERFGITSAEQLTFGFECTGRISAVGENVTQWQIGDEVMAIMLPDGFSSYVTVPAECAIAKPKHMSFVQAATLPLAFLTADYGLQHLAGLQPGERVLIHAAAGGVGQAAVQIAQQAGAEVFATASPGKWDFLKSMGVKHVMNSRTLDFALEIAEITAGKGVNVVLNSLNGDYIPKSLEVLAEGGRFVEIGKIGIWAPEQVKEKRPDVSYFPFDLGEAAAAQPGLIVELSDKLTPQWNSGKLKPLPNKVFPSTEVTTAFRYMQQAKQIGKVVVSMAETIGEQQSIKPDASYLITGGLGALGLEVAQWMVKEGAKHIVLSGRRSPNEKAQKIIEELEAAGAAVRVLLGDISLQEDVAKAISEISASLPPLKGVIHAAGVLNDGILLNQSWPQFAKVMGPKVAGTWYLHEQTKDLPLDFMVCFSSIASLLGGAGQGNYAAANAFMDALMLHRRSIGLPGLSINWGAWASSGMAASLAGQHQQRLSTSGMSSIEPEQGMEALGYLLSGSQSQVGVLPINWSQFVSQQPSGAKMPFLADLISSQQASTQKSSLRAILENAPVSKRLELLTSHVSSGVAKTLGWTDDRKVGMRQPLFDLGLDSLMAVELRNRLESSLETSLRSTVLFDYPTVEALVEYLAEEVIPIEFYADLEETKKESKDGSIYQEMSEAEIAEMLAKELEALGGES